MAVPKRKEPVKRKSIPYRFGDKHKAYMRRSETAHIMSQRVLSVQVRQRITYLLLLMS